MGDAPVDVGQPEVSSAVAVVEFLVIYAHEVKQRRVKVVDVHPFFFGVPAEFIR